LGWRGVNERAVGLLGIRKGDLELFLFFFSFLHKNINIPLKRTLFPLHYTIFGRTKEGNFGMTSEGLGESFKGDFTDTCSKKIPLVSMGG
jgi:hypothetical protein